MHLNLSFLRTKIIFVGQRSSPVHHTPPLGTYGASPAPYWNPTYAIVQAGQFLHRNGLGHLQVIPCCHMNGLACMNSMLAYCQHAGLTLDSRLNSLIDMCITCLRHHERPKAVPFFWPALSTQILTQISGYIVLTDWPLTKPPTWPDQYDRKDHAKVLLRTATTGTFSITSEWRQTMHF